MLVPSTVFSAHYRPPSTAKAGNDFGRTFGVHARTAFFFAVWRLSRVLFHIASQMAKQRPGRCELPRRQPSDGHGLFALIRALRLKAPSIDTFVNSPGGEQQLQYHERDFYEVLGTVVCSLLRPRRKGTGRDTGRELNNLPLRTTAFEARTKIRNA